MSFGVAHVAALLPELLAGRICWVRRLLVDAPAYLSVAGTRRTRRTSSTTPRLRLPAYGSGPLRTNNGDALPLALLDGLGPAVRPAFLVWDDLAAGRLEAALTDWSTPPIALNIVTPPGGLRRARVTAVIDHLVRCLSVAPWAMPAEG
jgi:DNA-binding transcriptional LysR family regulator